MEEVKQFNHRPTYAIETSKLIAALEHGETGDEITDAGLMDACGLNCAPGGRGYSYLQSAIRYCRRQGVIWKRIPGAKLIRCLNEAERMNSVDGDRKHARRVMNRSRQFLASIDPETLDNEGRGRYNRQVAHISTAALFLSGRTVKALEEQEKPEAVTDRKKLIALFSGDES